jgi:hypothetical protein
MLDGAVFRRSSSITTAPTIGLPMGPEVTGKTDRFVLFDSKRDRLPQLDHYHRWRDGGSEDVS